MLLGSTLLGLLADRNVDIRLPGADFTFQGLPCGHRDCPSGLGFAPRVFDLGKWVFKVTWHSAWSTSGKQEITPVTWINVARSNGRDFGDPKTRSLYRYWKTCAAVWLPELV